MARIISILLIVAGIVLIVYGYVALESMSSDISRLFTGSPTDKAVWMFGGGIFVTVIGIFGLLTSSKKK
jgi:uncharacterized membrane protein YidH (DUF202 family)